MRLSFVLPLVFLLFLLLLQSCLKEEKQVDSSSQQDQISINYFLKRYRKNPYPKVFCNVYLIHITYYFILVTFTYIHQHVSV